MVERRTVAIQARTKAKVKVVGAGARAYRINRVKASRVDEAAKGEGGRSVTVLRIIEGLSALDTPRDTYPCGAATCG